MSKYTAEQVDACILCYKSGDLNYCRQGIVDLLTDYAAHLRERESDVPEGMAATKLKPPLPKSFLGTEDFCFCDSLVSLQGISGDGSPEGYLGSVRLKVNGKFVTYVRERESAKVAVTDEMARKANYIYSSYVGGGIESMRAALEAVAPMLASARVPTGLRERINHAWHDHDEDGRVSISMGDARILVEQVLAAAQKPEKE